MSSARLRSKSRLASQARNIVHSVSCGLSHSDRVWCHLGPLSSLPSDSKNRIRTRGRCNGNLSSCRGSFSSPCWCLRGSQGAKKGVRGGIGGDCKPEGTHPGSQQPRSSLRGPPTGGAGGG